MARLPQLPGHPARPVPISMTVGNVKVPAASSGSRPRVCHATHLPSPSLGRWIDPGSEETSRRRDRPCVREDGRTEQRMEPADGDQVDTASEQIRSPQMARTWAHDHVSRAAHPRLQEPAGHGSNSPGGARSRRPRGGRTPRRRSRQQTDLLRYERSYTVPTVRQNRHAPTQLITTRFLRFPPARQDLGLLVPRPDGGRSPIARRPERRTTVPRNRLWSPPRSARRHLRSAGVTTAATRFGDLAAGSDRWGPQLWLTSTRLRLGSTSCAVRPSRREHRAPALGEQRWGTGHRWEAGRQTRGGGAGILHGLVGGEGAGGQRAGQDGPPSLIGVPTDKVSFHLGDQSSWSAASRAGIDCEGGGVWRSMTRLTPVFIGKMSRRLSAVQASAVTAGPPATRTGLVGAASGGDSRLLSRYRPPRQQT